MEKLPKVAIYLAIGIGVTIFALLLYSILPHMIQNSTNDWERAIGGMAETDEKILALFETHPSYIAFYETYPDAKQELNSRGRGDGNLQVGIMNFDTGNQLLLEMYYDRWNDSVNVHVRCNVMDDNGDRHRNLYADGLFAEDFIRNVNCLDIESEVTDTAIDDYPSGDVVTLQMKPLQ